MSHSLPQGPFGIVGLGLVGGSLARALSRALPAARLVGVDADARARAQVLSDHAVAEVLDAPGLALARCSVVFLCVPVAALPALLPSLAPYLAKDAILTDVTGVKKSVDALVRKTLPDVKFVGGHPMAGGELTGYVRSRADLFTGRSVALCPQPGEEPLAATVGTLWAAVGARPVVLSAEAHDRIVAATSHLPYLAALALTRVASASEGAERLVGRGLEGATRLANFPPEVMARAVAENPFAPIVARVLADELRRLADLAEKDPDALAAAAEEARTARAGLVSD